MLNRIYITERAIADSMYRRTKERSFTTEDVMRLHWNRQGHRALWWARERIKMMQKKGIVLAFKPDVKVEPDGRRMLYKFSEEQLERWNLH